MFSGKKKKITKSLFYNTSTDEVTTNLYTDNIITNLEAIPLTSSSGHSPIKKTPKFHHEFDNSGGISVRVKDEFKDGSLVSGLRINESSNKINSNKPPYQFNRPESDQPS